MSVLGLGESQNLWGAVALDDIAVGAGSLKAEALLSGGPEGYATFEMSFDTPPTAVSIDIEYSDGGNIWRKVGNLSTVGGDFLTIEATPGFYRGRLVSKTGTTQLITLSLTLSTVISRLRLGNSATPLVDDTPNTKFLQFYFDSGAPSGSAEGLYIRLYGTGSGATVQALRAFTSVTDVTEANARGAHISLSFGATGKITGLGVALECTLHIPTTAGMSGTVGALKVAINSDGASSDPVGALLSFIMIDNQGDATGGADVDDDAAVLGLSGFTQGAGNVFKTGADVAAAATLRIRVNGTNYFLLLGVAEAG